MVILVARDHMPGACNIYIGSMGHKFHEFPRMAFLHQFRRPAPDQQDRVLERPSGGNQGLLAALAVPGIHPAAVQKLRVPMPAPAAVFMQA